MNKDIIKSAIYGFIIGDILGVPVEARKREYLEQNPITDMIDNKLRRTTIGYWSDDTAMTLCTMQSLIDKNKVDYIDLLDKYLLWVRTGYMGINNKCYGIGGSTFRSILYYNRNKNSEYPAILNGMFANRDNPQSSGNGSLMRMLPIILYLYRKEIPLHEKRKVIEQVSDLTHCGWGCSESCVFYSVFIYNLIDTKDLIKAMEMSIKQFEDNFDINGSKLGNIITNNLIKIDRKEIKSTGYVIDTLNASLWCLFNTNSYEEAVLTAVNLGGDTDTIAAITGSMAGIYYGIDSIPQKWINNIRDKERIDIIINEFETLLFK